MSFNVKIMGADQSVDNVSGGNYLPSVQCSTQRSRLFKVSFTNISVATVYLWVFDTAAGSGSSTGAKMSRAVPAGLSDTWDFYAAGKLFSNGIFLAASTVAPTAASSAPTLAANNAMIITADIRVG